ncbi:S8 family serine peptidase [Kineosporia babensis]|uniref:S8 family serine peptidase n=1 Tax=Kineosporia babensis TaxID=499548 RepID=A0A9X1NLL2_9ACTN|nr:S8 family serine peptidase [Kineosporia babensis]
MVDSGIAANLNVFREYSISRDTDFVSSSHGTMMASVALGVNGLSAEAVDPDLVEVLSINIDAGTDVGADAIARGIGRAVDRGADVILVSRGVRRGADALQAAVQQASSHGAMVVAAAGNVRFLPADYPARYPDVLSVGARYRDGRLWELSASEPVDTFAAGVNVPVVGPDGVVRTESGTSIAAAVVARDVLQQLVTGELEEPRGFIPMSNE